jgi:molybdopterin-guanine dinucleotide biosynthesis protein A
MGRNKSLIDFRGKPLLLRQLEILRPLFGRVVVAAGDPAPYAPFGVEVVPDLLPERCALAGIHAVLSASSTAGAFVVACDLPFLNPSLIEALLERREGNDAVIPESNRGVEPLHSLYSRACLRAIEDAARRGVWKATGFHPAVRVLRWRVRDEDWAVDGRSPFLNVNSPEDLGAAAS